MKLCPRCKAIKEETQFNRHRGKKDGLQPYCKPCQYQTNGYRNRKIQINEWQNRRRQRNRERFCDWLSSHPCVDCGERDIVVLELDHREPKGKRTNAVSLMISTNRSWETILKEVGKCVVRCANCHRRKTARQFGYFKWKRTQADGQNSLQSGI